MKEYDPMESFTNAFLDLGKRVIVFFTCFILGLIEGSIASAIANVFSKIKEVVSKQPPAQEWYEDTNTRFIDFPRLSLIVIGIIGCASACLGMYSWRLSYSQCDSLEEMAKSRNTEMGS